MRPVARGSAARIRSTPLIESFAAAILAELSTTWLPLVKQNAKQDTNSPDMNASMQLSRCLKILSWQKLHRAAGLLYRLAALLTMNVLRTITPTVEAQGTNFTGWCARRVVENWSALLSLMYYGLALRTSPASASSLL